MKRLLMSALAVSVLVVGCKKHREPDGIDRPGPPDPIWSATQASVLEGGKVTLILSLDREPDDDYTVELGSDAPALATVPASVTFPAGTTSLSVTVTTAADADAVESIARITATAVDDEDRVAIRLLEDDAAAAPGLGPVPFATNACLMAGPGADGAWQTADDVLRVVENVGIGAPAFTDVVVGAITPGPHALPVVTGVGDAVVVLTNGADLTLGTVDDALVQVEDVLTAPAVTATLVVGRMESSEARRPVVVGSRVVIASRGADLLTGADDALLIVSGLGTVLLSMSSVAVPGLAFEAPSIPVPIGADAVLLATSGGDFVFGTGNETQTVVTPISGAAAPTAILIGDMPESRAGMPVAIGPTTFSAVIAGPDTVQGTADDALVVARDVFTVPAATLVPAIGAVAATAHAQGAATGGDAVLVPVMGADLAAGTADDQVALVAACSTPLPVLTTLAAAAPATGAHGRLVVLSSSAAARFTAGADLAAGTADDGLVLLTSLTGAAATSTFATGAFAAARPVATSATSVAFAGEGLDAAPGTADDRTLEVTGIGAAPVLNFNLTGSFNPAGDLILVPITGDSVLVARGAGADNAPGTADDVLAVSPIP